MKPRSFFGGLLSRTGATVRATVWPSVRVALVSFVPSWAIRFCGSLKGRSFDGRYIAETSSQVFLQANQLHVARINAAPDTTQMINLQTVRNRANEGFIRHSMRQLGYVSRNRHAPVSITSNAPNPKPAAGVWLWHAKIHQTIYDWYYRNGHCDSSKVSMSRPAVARTTAGLFYCSAVAS